MVPLREISPRSRLGIDAGDSKCLKSVARQKRGKRKERVRLNPHFRHLAPLSIERHFSYSPIPKITISLVNNLLCLFPQRHKIKWYCPIFNCNRHEHFLPLDALLLPQTPNSPSRHIPTQIVCPGFRLHGYSAGIIPAKSTFG